MLEQAANMLENHKEMTNRLTRKKYEENMKAFRAEYGAVLAEMTVYTESAADKEAAAGEVAAAFTDAVQDAFASPKNGKIKGYLQVDLNLFMIYYVFPALLLTEHEDAKLIANAICKTWNKRFHDCNISYTDYETLLDGFCNKIFGIF